jgi:hypothetical protein
VRSRDRGIDELTIRRAPGQAHRRGLSLQRKSLPGPCDPVVAHHVPRESKLSPGTLQKKLGISGPFVAPLRAMTKLKTSLEAWTARFLLALPLASALGCNSHVTCEDPNTLKEGNEDLGLIGCNGGLLHRAKAAPCPPAPACVNAAIASTCSSDTDCAATGNRCVQSGAETCSCESDCSTDAECGAGKLCQCGYSISSNAASVCVSAECRTDADCSGGLCAAYVALDATGCDVGNGFACETNADECEIDSDCPNAGICGFTGGHRVCAMGGFNGSCCTQQEIMANACGRPFLIGGNERTAAETSRGDWASRIEPNLEGMTRERRTELAHHWVRIGLMEHASIAAFARFALQLLSVGAPPDLIQDAQRAMRDETEHTRLAFGLASAYAGQPIGPGRLEIANALDANDDHSILVMVLREGCIGETLAALEAEEALAHATDPVVRKVLETITEDERRHALLAWRYVVWAISQGGIDVRATCQAELELASAKAGEGLPQAGLLEHGVLGSDLQHELRRRAINEVIRPSFDRLFALPDSTSERRQLETGFCIGRD